MTIVKEPFSKEKYVKDQNSKYNIIKFIYTRTVPTGVYDYFQQAVAFFDINSGKVLKLSLSSQDGCGNTYAEYRRKDNLLEYYSYFDGQGHIKKEIKDNNFIFYETLPLTARFFLGKGKVHHVKIMEPLLANKYKEPVIREYKLRVTEKDKTWLVNISDNQSRDELVFEKDYPYSLLRWNKDDGDQYKNEKNYFFKYWEKTGNDERELVK